MNIKTKMIALGVVPLLASIVASISLGSYTIGAMAVEIIAHIEKSEIKRQKDNLLEDWQIFESSFEDGTTEKGIKETVSRTKFGTNGYFIYFKPNKNIISHGKDPKLNGTLIDASQPETRKLVKCRSTNGCFDTINITDSRDGKVHEKMYYTVYLENYDALITTGVVLTDIEYKLEAIESLIESVKSKEISFVIMVMGSFAAIAVVFSLLFSNHISGRLTNLVKEVNNIASGDGDLRHQIKIYSDDEIGMLGSALNKFISSLRTMVLDINHAASEIETSSSSLSMQSSEIASSMSMQMQETEMVATAISEMSSTAQSVSDTATATSETTEQTNRQAQDAISIVESTNEHVVQMAQDFEVTTSKINELCAEAENIGKVTTVIGDIADQTNLLALNAAIEAARAGDQGRGFAVVADEVRALAARTADSTKEINHMLNNLNSLVADSVRLIGINQEQSHTTEQDTKQASSQLVQVVSAIENINEMNVSVASAAEEQSMVSEEINVNLNKLQDIATNLSSSSEKTATMVEQLHSSSKNIVDLVSRFKV